jgi:cytochrome b
VVDGLDRDERDALVSKRHEKREAEKRRSRWKLRKKRENGGYTHNPIAASVVFMLVFLVLVVGVIEVMGRWANGTGSRGSDRALHGQRLPGFEGLPTLPRSSLR